MDNTERQTQPQGIELLGESFIQNPFPVLAELRKAGPIFQLPYSQGGRAIWVVTQFDAAVQALKDARFTVNPNPKTGGGNGLSMLSVDGDEHARLRGFVSKAFTPRYIEGLRPRIQEIADELLDQVQQNHQMDLVNDYAYPLPINVISEILGVPPKDRGRLREGAELIITSQRDLNDDERYHRYIDFAEYVTRLIRQKAKAPGTDLISELVMQNDLSENELHSLVFLLILAGHETTSNLIANGTLALLDNPTQIERLKADFSLIPGAVEELLRYSSPLVVAISRFATETLEFCGAKINKGDMVMVAIAAADRDTAQFSDPEVLDVVRKLNKHIAFGQGIHYCLGAPLARIEGEIAFTTLLRRCPDLALAIPREQVTWRGNLNLRGLRSLPVSF